MKSARDCVQAQADLAHVNRVTTMGELTASLAHEVNQPIAAAITNANTCMRWLAATHQISKRRARLHENRKRRNSRGGNHQAGPAALKKGSQNGSWLI